ncbi:MULTISPECIES: hypothetical protein [Cytobacillus]|uniref:hypothetical protein n=1 Tax=Cytobacillus TaxID=2675230 RepID=UPI001356CD0B|nr:MULTISPECIES: hypothetical protein [Cytobacillus]KAF0816109.1 hypothetical protein KIS4809_5093 [Bacillus sp. ZZV12-4809]MCM3093972.1 hypothetical protein [Cytobacillus sp. AMY 15.2]MCM3705021.1 hypothetical protein [Cytobacillus firmus]
MKKIIQLLSVFVLTVSILLPFSTNAQTREIPPQPPQEVLNEETGQECGCENDNSENSLVKESIKVEDTTVINNFKSQYNQWESLGVTYYNTNEFNWNEVTLTKYENGDSSLVVPSTKLEQGGNLVFLMAGYSVEDGEILNPILMEIDPQENDERPSVEYKTLDNVAVAGFLFSEDGEYLEKIEYPDNQVNGYWNDVAKCIKNSWSKIPSWLRTVCSSACFSVVFGGNIWGAAVCAGCLGGHVMHCMMSNA